MKEEKRHESTAVNFIVKQLVSTDIKILNATIINIRALELNGKPIDSKIHAILIYYEVDISIHCAKEGAGLTDIHPEENRNIHFSQHLYK